MKAQDLRIIVVEDERETREAFGRAIASEADFDLVASCATFQSAAAALVRHKFDVLVTDLQLPDGNGIDLIKAARKQHPNAEIMVISILGDETTVVSAISSGASGFLLKDARNTDVIVAIRDLVDGKSPISTAVARYIIKLAQQMPELKTGPDTDATSGKSSDGLTDRELDILWGIAKGFTYKDVAERLGLSPNTIPSHIKNIYRKLEVNSRGEAVFEALQRGIINL